MKNVLIIHVDQLRWDCIGAYGNKDIKTPNIDRIAEDGIRYNHSYCAHPICTPSRYSMLTGTFPHNHGGYDNNTTLRPEFTSLPQVLRDHGYQTSCVGKMHFRPTYLEIGFDTMILAEQNGEGRYDDDYHRMLREKGLIDSNDLFDQEAIYNNEADQAYWSSMGAMASNLPEQYHSTTFVGDKACEILENWGEGSHMMMVGFIKPHHPFDPPAPWSEMYNPDELTLLDGWSETVPEMDDDFMKFDFNHLDESTLKNIMAKYYGSISQIDYHVGLMIDKLKKLGVYEDTLIVFTSDHGEYMGCHHLLLKCQNHYDPLMRIPLLMKYPKGLEDVSKSGGVVCNNLVSNVDLAPTLLNYLECEIPDTMTGIDMNTQTNMYVYCVGEPMTIRSEKYKLMMKDNGEHLFFDLEKDPSEMDNLYGNSQYLKQVNDHMAQLFSWYRNERRTEIYIDDKAPLSKTPNRLLGEESVRDDMKKYMWSKMFGDCRA